VNEGLVNFTGMPSLGPFRDTNSVCQQQHMRCFPLLYSPPYLGCIYSKRLLGHSTNKELKLIWDSACTLHTNLHNLLINSLCVIHNDQFHNCQNSSAVILSGAIQMFDYIILQFPKLSWPINSLKTNNEAENEVQL